jgi:hypothetical protein
MRRLGLDRMFLRLPLADKIGNVLLLPFLELLKNLAFLANN